MVGQLLNELSFLGYSSREKYKSMNYKRQSILIWSIIILIGILTAALAASSQNLAPPEAPVTKRHFAKAAK